MRIGRARRHGLLKGVASGAALLLAGGALVAFTVVPKLIQRALNRVVDRPPYTVSPAAQRLHDSLIVVDLHADPLLWSRDLVKRSRIGHVDIPRLIEGNVALQAFTVVTKTPRGMNVERTEGRSDNVTALIIFQRWPFAAWTSLKERALYQARKLRQFADRSEGRLTIIGTADDLARYLERREEDADITAGFLGIEGAHALERDLANVDVFAEAGFRMMAPTHFFDNALGGSAHGVEKGGLTEFGRQVIRRMEERGMLVDLAHASSAVIDDVLEIARRPTVVSHTGVRGTCDNPRNISDKHVREIAAQGGVIGIGFWSTAVCGTDASATARAIRYVADLVGVGHVGLGSDFDGAITALFDASGMATLTEALLAQAFSPDEIRAIMGGNVVNILMQVLPQR